MKNKLLDLHNYISLVITFSKVNSNNKLAINAQSEKIIFLNKISPGKSSVRCCCGQRPNLEIQNIWLNQSALTRLLGALF